MANFIYGTSGDDVLIGTVVSDSIDAGTGNDILDGDAGDDTLYGRAGNDTLNGGDGDDSIYASNGSVEVERIDGGQGFDFLELDNSSATSNLTVTYTNKTNGTVSNGTTFKNIESLRLYTAGGSDIINVSALGNAKIYSNGGNDSITTGASKDIIDGGSGNDIINAGASDDTLYGRAGNDTLNGGDGDDSIYASDGSVEVERIDGGQGFDFVEWDNSSATSNLTVTYTNKTNGTVSNGSTFKNIESLDLYTGSGSDIINVSALGNAEIYSNGGNDSITTGNGGDILGGGTGNDILNAGAGDDTLYGRAGNDTLNGGDGDDSIYASDGSVEVERIDGGQGFDFVEWDNSSATSNLTVTYTNKTNGTVSNGSTFKNIESLDLYTGSGSDIINVSALGNATIYSNGGNDTLTTGAGNDGLYGGNGNDTLNAGAGNDILDGGTGSDTLSAGAGDDTLYGRAGNDILNSGDGNDSIYASNGSLEIETIDGGQGFDFLELDNSSSTSNLTVTYTNLTNGTVSNGTTFKNIESLRLYTGSGNDIINVTFSGSSGIYSNAGNDSITTGAGKDILDGGTGNDSLNAGAGNDILYGRAGNDILNSGDGNDSIYASNGSLEVETINGGQGFDFLELDNSSATSNLTVTYTNPTNGTVSNGTTFKNIESLDLYTGNGNDIINVTALGNAEIYGNAGNDSITTGVGNDKLFGGDGNDTLNGGDGNDYISGENGNDILNGGAGNDSLYGGDGNDILNAGAGDDYISDGVGVRQDTINGGAGYDYLKLDNSTIISTLIYTYTNTTNGTNNYSATFRDIEALELYTGRANDTINVTAAAYAEIYSGDGDDSITTGAGNDKLFGGDGNDILNSGAGDDYISDGVGVGQDTINGGAGYDYLKLDDSITISTMIYTYTNTTNGTNNYSTTFRDIEALELYTGNANDTINVTAAAYAEIYSGDGDDSITTGAGNDKLFGGDGNDILNSGAGDDYISDGVGVGQDTINGGAGYDYLKLDNRTIISPLIYTYTNTTNGTDNYGTTFRDIEALELYTGNANDTINVTAAAYAEIYSGDGDDSITTGAGNDKLFGGDGNDILNSGAGDDYISDGVGVGQDTINGGAGYDYLKLDNRTIISPLIYTYTNTTNGTDNYGTTFRDIEALELYTGNANDTINVTAAAYAEIYSGDGNDSITTGAGNDKLFGGDGNDILNSGAGDDYISDGVGVGQDTINGGAGYDYLKLDDSITISTMIYTYTNTTNGTNNYGTTFRDIEALELYTGNANDTINVTAAAYAEIYSGDGNDSITTGAGNDKLFGGDGNDILNSGAGDDYISDGVGVGQDTINGGAGYDYLKLDNTTIISPLIYTYTNTTNGTNNYGTTFRDIEALELYTGNANDTINVTAAAYAEIYGGDGNDSITTGAGNDKLFGGDGNDILTGGAGSDRFTFNSFSEGIDRITDFSVVNDTIVVSALGFGGGLFAGTAIAASQFALGSTATTSNQRFLYDQSTGGLFFDQDGTGAIAKIQFATLNTGLSLTNADIFVNP